MACFVPLNRCVGSLFGTRATRTRAGPLKQNACYIKKIVGVIYMDRSPMPLDYSLSLPASFFPARTSIHYEYF
jgi:hypothetical protein